VYLTYAHDPPEVNNYTGLAGPDGAGNRASRVTRVTADASTGYKTIIANSEVVILGASGTWSNFNAFVDSTVDFDEPPAGILPSGENLQDFLAADSQSHTVNALEFGPDGMLYISNGDGTSYNQMDPSSTRVQDIDNALKKSSGLHETNGLEKLVLHCFSPDAPIAPSVSDYGAFPRSIQRSHKLSVEEQFLATITKTQRLLLGEHLAAKHLRRTFHPLKLGPILRVRHPSRWILRVLGKQRCKRCDQ
jgi:hypothetical protein